MVEGQTEEEFVKEILLPYFQKFGIYDVVPIKIATSSQKGGFVNYQHLKNDILKRIREKNIVITTFVDFFRIPNSIPVYKNCMENNAFIDDKIICLEDNMKQDIGFPNFIPYIQKHEFEALLFSSDVGFKALYSNTIVNSINDIIEKYSNPENINLGADTAPSKRIEKIYKENGEKYNKIIDGNLIALEIGMENILQKCPRFQAWVKKIIQNISAS